MNCATQLWDRFKKLFRYEQTAAAALSITLAGLILSGLEYVWLLERGYGLTIVRIIYVAGLLTAAVAVAGLILGTLLALGRKILPRFPAAVLVLAGIWPAYFAAESLFAGGFIRDIPGIRYIKIGFIVGLLVAIVISELIFRRFDAVETRARRRVFAVALALATITVAFVDSHVQVGLYPAAHFLLVAAVLYAVLLCAVLATPRPGRIAGRLAIGWIALAILMTGASWQSADQVSLATYSDGLIPKVRETVVTVSRGVTNLKPSGPMPAPELKPDEFRFRATAHPELDAIRSRVSNVVFVLVDAMRHDHIGLVRDGRSTTPFLDAASTDLIRFRNAYSGSDRTGQSMPVLMTSYPLPVVFKAMEHEIVLQTWIDLMRQRGVATYANGNCDYLTRKHPHMPIHHCYGAEEIGSFRPPDPTVLVSEIVDFVQRAEGQPFAVFTHWMDAHINRTHKNMQDHYAEMVQQVDQRISELVAGLESVGHLDDTIIVITADHGFALGEHNRYLGNQCCAERQVRVPLLIRLPGSSHAGRVIETNVAAIDVVPTILDLLMPASSTTVGGRSMLGLLYDDQDPRLQNDHSVYGVGKNVHMIRTGDLKMHWNEWRNTRLVVNVREDPHEVRPVVSGSPRELLWDALQEEYRRHERLAATVAARGYPDLEAGVLMALMRSDIDDASVRPLLTDYWEHTSDTRRYLLQAVYKYSLTGLRDDLDVIARSTWDVDDQMLLVMRSFVRSPNACQRLVEQLPELGVEARLLLAEMFSALSGECRTALAAPLLDVVRQTQKQRPHLRDPEGRFLAFSTYMLSGQFGDDTPRELRVALADLFNQAVALPTQFTLPSIKGPVLTRQVMFLESLERTIKPGDLDILEQLVVDKYSVRTIATLCLQFGTAESHALLMEIIKQPLDVAEASAVIRVLRGNGDDATRRQASQVLAERFPTLDASIERS